MLLGKEPSKFEVYNDIEGELVNFFRVVKNRPAELLLELDLLPLNSREEFASWLHFHDGGNEPNIHLPDQLEIIDRTTPSSLTEEAEKLKTSLRKRSDYRDVRQAAAYLMRVRNSYSSSGRSFACQPFSVRTLFTQIWEMSRRLENVIIEQQSFEVLIPHYDRDDSFFYGDPPYYDSEYVYDAEFGWVNAVVRLFTLFGWALFTVGVVGAVFEVAIESQSGRVSIKGAALNVLKGFFACALIGVLPVELYKFCVS